MVDDPGRGDRAVYQIRVRGIIGPQWSAWFDDLAIVLLADGETLLTGPAADLAALHGLLARIRDLGLPLLAVTRVEEACGRAE